MGSVTIENLRIGMDRLEGLLNEFAPSATMKSTIRPNENTASRSYGGFAPVDPPTLPLAQSSRRTQPLPGQSTQPPSLSMSRQLPGRDSLPLSTEYVKAFRDSQRVVGGTLPLGGPPAAAKHAPVASNPTPGPALPFGAKAGSPVRVTQPNVPPPLGIAPLGRPVVTFQQMTVWDKPDLTRTAVQPTQTVRRPDATLQRPVARNPPPALPLGSLHGAPGLSHTAEATGPAAAAARSQSGFASPGDAGGPSLVRRGRRANQVPVELGFPARPRDRRREGQAGLSSHERRELHGKGERRLS